MSISVKENSPLLSHLIDRLLTCFYNTKLLKLVVKKHEDSKELNATFIYKNG